MDAWRDGDSDQLAELAIPMALDELKKVPAMDTAWADSRCDADRCFFWSAAGDEAGVRIPPDLVGRPHAVTQVFGNKTEFDPDELNYVLAFEYAWSVGNERRMLALSDEDVMKWVADLKPPTTRSTEIESGMLLKGRPILVIWRFEDRTFHVYLRADRLGKAHAIERICLNTCA